MKHYTQGKYDDSVGRNRSLLICASSFSQIDEWKRHLQGGDIQKWEEKSIETSLRIKIF